MIDFSLMNEAEKYAKEICSKYFEENCHKKNKWADTNDLVAMWQDGYNKANEWHNLEENPDDLPKENMKQVIVGLSDGSYEMGYYCIHQGIWYNDECDGDPLEYYYFDEKIKAIKWKEIIPPKENE